jgi:hypothetical protein
MSLTPDEHIDLVLHGVPNLTPPEFIPKELFIPIRQESESDACRHLDHKETASH